MKTLTIKKTIGTGLLALALLVGGFSVRVAPASAAGLTLDQVIMIISMVDGITLDQIVTLLSLVDKGAPVAIEPAIDEPDSVADLAEEEDAQPDEDVVEPEDMEEAVEEEADDDVRFIENDRISAEVLSSSSSTPSDTARFKFVITLTPFDDPIYVPVSSSQAVDIDLVNASTGTNDPASPSVSLSSSAARVSGGDGNSYFKISSPKDITIIATVAPGAGDYYAELDAVSFTSDDVTEGGYVFSGTRLGLSSDTWKTTVVSLLN